VAAVEKVLGICDLKWFDGLTTLSEVEGQFTLRV